MANEGVEVRSYFEEWVKGTLSRTHSVCIWHFKSAGKRNLALLSAEAAVFP